ncbi:MAG: hypothetical protein ACPGTH_01940 [Parvibaculales bacterium]
MAAINDCALNKMNNVDNEDKLRCPRSQEILSPSCRKQTRFIHGLSNAHALFVKYGDNILSLDVSYLSPLSPLLMLPVFKASHSMRAMNLEKINLTPLSTVTYSHIVFWG